MTLSIYFPKRGDTTAFSKTRYEIIFSIFMVFIFYLYKQSHLSIYPPLLLLFMSLFAANFSFNRLLSARGSVSIWFVDTVLLSNIFIIAAVIAKSGGYLSYFWVLYLLPIFTAALTGLAVESVLTVAFCILALASCSLRPAMAETTHMLSLGVKAGVFISSAFVIYRIAFAKKRLEAEMEFKRNQVEKLITDASKRDFIALNAYSAAEAGNLAPMLLHDISNMVGVILVGSQVLKEEIKENGQCKNDIENIITAALMVRKIIINAIDFMKSGGYDFKPCSIKDAVASSLAMLEYHIRAKGVSVSVFMEEGLPELNMSMLHIQRSFINIIVNSLFFLASGGALKISAMRQNDFVKISFEDNGPGFPREMLSSPIASYKTTRKGGTGLGLFGASETMKRHGGKISLINRQPSGAVVEFYLPINPNPSSKESAK